MEGDMVYVRLSSVFVLLGIGSGLCAMKMSLKDIAADAVLKDKANIGLLEQGPDVSLDARQVVRTRFLSENLRGLWDAIPVVKSLLPRAQNNPLKGLSFIGTTACAITAKKNGTLYWWDTNNIELDLTSGEVIPLAVRETGHREVSAFALNADGSRLATAGGKMVHIWNADATVCLGSLEHPQDVCAISFNDATTEIVVGGTRGEVWVWDLQDQKAPTSSYVHVRLEDNLASLNRILGVRLSSDGKTVFSAVGYSHARKASIKSWDRLTPASEPKEILLDSRAIIGKMAFVDDLRAITSFTNGDLLVTNLLLGTTEKINLGVKLESSVFGADGRYLLTCCQNKKVVLWHKAATGYDIVREFEGSGLIMNHCAIRSDGNMFLAGGCFGSLDMWCVDQPFNDFSLEEAQSLLKKTKNSEVSGSINSASGK